MEELSHQNDDSKKSDGTQIVQRTLAAKLTLLKGVLSRKEFEFAGPEFSLGRAEECNLRLKDFKVSRIHAIIRLKSGECLIEDQGSRNGTFVNGERIAEPTCLESGSVLRVGDMEFRFSLVDAAQMTSSIEPAAVVAASLLSRDSAAMPVLSLPSRRWTSLFLNKRVRLWGGAALAIGVIVGISKWPDAGQTQAPAEVAKQEGEGEHQDAEAKVEQVLAEALLAYREGRLSDAMKGAGIILQVSPRHEKARDLLMASEQAQVAQQEKVEQFRREREAKELADQVAFYYSLGLEHFNKGSLAAAVENFEKVLEIDPSHEEARLKLAVATQKETHQKSTQTADETTKGEKDVSAGKRVADASAAAWGRQKNEEAKKLYTGQKYGKAIALLKEIVSSKRKLPPDLLGSAKRGLFTVREALSQEYSAELTQAEVLFDAAEYGKAQIMLEGILREDAAHPKAAALAKSIHLALDEEAKRIYIEAVVDENVGDLEVARSKFRQIASTVSKENVYYKKAVEKLRKLK